MDNEMFQKLVLERLDSQDQFRKETLQFQEKALERFDSYDKFQDLVLEYFGKVFEDLESVKKDQRKLAIRVENEVITKIQALFDGYAAHDETLSRVEDRLEDVATDARYLVARATKLEKMAK